MWIAKIKDWYDRHQSQTDLAIGGSVGGATATDHYWDHFTEPETLYHFYDALINTCIHTVVAAVLLWALHKFILKSKKNGKDNTNGA